MTDKKQPHNHTHNNHLIDGSDDPENIKTSVWTLRRATQILVIAFFAFLGIHFLLGGKADTPYAGVITNYTNPKFQTAIGFGSRSFWGTQDRGYMTTVPATTLLNAVGVNFDGGGQKAAEVPQVIHLLKDVGIKHVRLPIDWGGLTSTNPGTLSPGQQTKIQNEVKAIGAAGMRPLIILQAYDEQPVPYTHTTAKFTVKPKVGDTSIAVDTATAAAVVLNKSGLNQHGVMAGNMIVAKKGNILTLSKPINDKTDLSGKIVTLSYGPFQNPFMADGVTPNPAFTDTMSGWLDYVKTITNGVKSALGNDNFDIEIWNELTSSSNFLNADTYYTSNTIPDANTTGNQKGQILKQTAAFFANPANGLSDVQVTDGFASQTPFVSSSNLPNDVIAMSKHYYTIGQNIYPQDANYNGDHPLNGLFQLGTSSKGTPYVDTFVPTFVSHFPEEWMSGANPQSQITDMSPITTFINGQPHGTSVPNQGGQKTQVWETEWNTSLAPDPNGLQPTGTSGKQQKNYSWDPASRQYIQAKADIRYLSSFVNKGLSQVDFYSAVANGEMGLIDTGFTNSATSNPTVFPGDAAGGEIMQVLQRYLGSFSGATKITSPQSLSLNEIDDYSGNLQFKGNGTAEYPNLYDRDVLGFYPYQVTNSKFIVPIYVQTRDIEKIYNKSASDIPTKFNLPQEEYRLTIGGINGNNVTSISYADPLTQGSPNATIVSKSSTNIVVDLYATDSPRLLSINMCTTGCGGGKGGPTHAAPTVTISAPANNTTVSGQVDINSLTTTDPSTFVASVQYYINNINDGHLYKNAPYAFTWNTKTVGNGTYTITAVVQDGTGVSSTSAPITLTVNNSSGNGNQSVPQISIVAPKNNATVNGKTALRAHAYGSNGTTVSYIQYTLDGKSLGPKITKAPDYLYNWDATTFAKGTHSLSATVTDSSGQSAAATPITVTNQ